MSKVKVTIAVSVAALAFSMIAASAASAAWWVGGTELTSGHTEALATTAKVDSHAVLSVPSVGIKVECTSEILGGKGPKIVGAGNGEAEALIFEGCKTIEPTSNCELENQPNTEIETQPVEAIPSLRAGDAPADLVNFKPKGKLFAEIPFDNTDTCAFAGKQPVKGQVLVNAPTGQSEEELQAIEGLGSAEGNNSLEVGGDKSFIVGGKALLKLSSAQKWSFK